MNDMEIKKGDDVTDDIVDVFKRLRMIINCNAVELSGDGLTYVKGIHKGIEFRDSHENRLEGDIEVRILAVHDNGTVVFEAFDTEKRYMFSLLPNDIVKRQRGPKTLPSLLDTIMGGLFGQDGVQGELVACGIKNENGEIIEMMGEDGNIVSMEGDVPEDLKNMIPGLSDMLGENGGLEYVVECPGCGNFIKVGKPCIFCENGEDE